MSDFLKQQADMLKSWRETQEKLTKQYAEWGEAWGANPLGKMKGEASQPDFYGGWSAFVKGMSAAQESIQEQSREFTARLNEMATKTWGGKIPGEGPESIFKGDLYRNWFSMFEPSRLFSAWGGAEWQKETGLLGSIIEQCSSFYSTLGKSISNQMNQLFGMAIGTMGQEESSLSDSLTGYEDAFNEMWEKSTSQYTGILVEAFEAWAKEVEKNLSAPKLGINRELAQEVSQFLIFSQEYTHAYLKLWRLLDSTGRRAGLRFHSKLRELTVANRPVTKFEDLCALWSVENEKVFTEVMSTEEFAQLQGNFVDAGHRLKIQATKLAERALEPTPFALKRDLDLAIAEITQLRREIRALQRELKERDREHQQQTEGQGSEGQEAEGHETENQETEIQAAETHSVGAEKAATTGQRSGSANTGRRTAKPAPSHRPKAKAREL